MSSSEMPMKPVLLALAFLAPLVVAACATPPTDPAPIRQSGVVDPDRVTAIQAVLKRQQTAWNRGDINGFMRGYWQSPDLRFASGGDLTRGWQETLDRYKARYDSAAKMGALSFTALEVVELGPDAAVVHGRWALQRANDVPAGQFTLIMRRIGGDWVIISDTTTLADP